MKYSELIILLPCHSLEDFPTYHEGDDAASLLANWTALWHPALLASAGKMPQWHRVDDPPEELACRLIVAPTVSTNELPVGFQQRATDDGAVFIRRKLDRNEILAEALEHLDGGDGGVNAELAADFLALGYCFLQVELLTRQMRYSSNLDEVYFQKQAIAGAVALMEGDEAGAREKLEACFNVLAEERDHYYPVDAFIIDLTLVAPTTIGAGFRNDLSRSLPVNVLLDCECIRTIAAEEPETLQALQDALNETRLTIIGGEAAERRLPLLSNESILSNLRQGLAEYHQHLRVHPTVYGRRRYGLTPALPHILKELGFKGAFHATLDAGKFPEGSQIKTGWEGIDGDEIDALARAPVDASLPQTFLNLAVKMGESMDMDHVATVVLAHWAGVSSPWFDDLRRIGSYCPALGKFITLDEYFRETDSPAHPERFEADQYRSPYFKQAIVRKHVDPISSPVRYWRRRAKLEAAEALHAMASLVTGDVSELDTTLADTIDALSESHPPDGHPAGVAGDALDAQLEGALQTASDRAADCLLKSDPNAPPGYLVLNPCSFVRRVGVETPQLTSPVGVEKPVYASDGPEDRKPTVVDVPPLGFAWLQPGKAKPRRKEPPLAEQGVLRNEFLEALIHPQSGALQSLHSYQKRGNRMSQQLGYRIGDSPRGGDHWDDDDGEYSTMVAEQIDVTVANTTLGEIVVKGALTDPQGDVLANFTQKFQVWRGSRVLRIEIELDPQVEPKADPWNSYFASRFAWKDESALLWRTMHQTRQPVTGKRIEAPHYVQVDEGELNSVILTGGLTFHRVIGARRLDTLLITRGETQRKFQLGVGLDLSHPMNEAMSFISPPPAVYREGMTPAAAASSWLFHIDSRNVISTHWSPIIEEGEIKGVRTRLIETAGRGAKCKLSAFREIKSAARVDFQGEKAKTLEIEEGKAKIDIPAHGWIEVEGRWTE